MLTITHQIIGSLVVTSNGIAALWLYLLAHWGREMSRGPGLALWLARGTLGLQLLLGLMLVAGGAVGQGNHYLFALGAVAALWYSHMASSKQPGRLLQILALGCGAAFLCSLAAYVVGRS